MAIAEIHGKSVAVYSEDQLTADVFTAFRYLPADRGIIGFLRTVSGLGDIIPQPDESSTCQFHFWPLGLKFRREPDVLLELAIDGRVYHVVIEAKYLSGPSDGEDIEVVEEDEVLTVGNQLADQYRDLRGGKYALYSGSVRDRILRLQSEPETRVLLYLTSHLFPPSAELDGAIERCADGRTHLFWTSWYAACEYLSKVRETMPEFPCQLVVGDLLTLLDKKGFSGFSGVRAPSCLDMRQMNPAFWVGDRVDAPG